MARHWRIFLSIIFSFYLSTAWAGGALKTNIDGVPFTWGSSLVFNPENGALKPGVYDKAQSQQLIREAFAQWAALPGIRLQILQGEALPDGGDVTQSNYQMFYHEGVTECYDDDPYTPCYSPIIFDEDGSILEDMFGECAQFTLLGFAGFRDMAGNSDDAPLTELKRGQAIFSGACIAPAISKPGCPPCVVVLEDHEVRSLMLHEVGHLLGMDHSQVNPDSYLGCRQEGDCPEELSEHIPTMFPLLVKGSGQVTLHRDDEAQFQKLYGDPQNGFCSISGDVYAADGVTPLRGVEVVARNVDPEKSFTDAISFVSGAEAPRRNAKEKVRENCVGDCGAYRITGLTPGETYRICYQRILSDFNGTRALNPVEEPFQDIDNACPESLTVTCNCPEGRECPEYPDRDVITANTGLDASMNHLLQAPSAWGCSLMQPVPVRLYLWSKMLRILRLNLSA